MTKYLSHGAGDRALFRNYEVILEFGIRISSVVILQIFLIVG